MKAAEHLTMADGAIAAADSAVYRSAWDQAIPLYLQAMVHMMRVAVLREYTLDDSSGA